MNEPKPSGAAEVRAKLTLQVEAMKTRFKTRHGFDAQQVRLGRWTDLYLGDNLYSSGDEIAGLYIERFEDHLGVEVGVWESN